jgi:dipeptidyl aminopeptidase/acylaminoacyl peptidase
VLPKPLPMVLPCMAAPGRETSGFDPNTNGWRIAGLRLSVNSRLDRFGKALVNAGDLEWGRKMHDDLIDAVDWAVANGIALRDRIAIMGGSYGGYATLAGLTFTPEVFCCGVDIVGPSNLETLLATIPPYWAAFSTDPSRRRSEDGAGPQALQERSPLNSAGAITGRC